MKMMRSFFGAATLAAGLCLAGQAGAETVTIGIGTQDTTTIR